MSKTPALVVLFAAATLLALMNLLLCWFCPPVCDIYINGLNGIICPTASKTLTGLLLCGMAVVVGWRRWLDAGPFICLAWLCLVACAVVFPQIDCGRGKIAAGLLKVDFWGLAPLAAGLLAAWLSCNLKSRSDTAAWLFSGIVVGFIVGGAVAYAAKTSQLAMLGGQLAESVPRGACASVFRDVEHQCAELVRSSECFGAVDVVQNAPWCAFAAALPTAATTAFGGWYRVLLYVATCLLGTGFAMAFRCVPVGPKRSFVVILGIAAVVPLMMNCLGCMLCEPLMTTGILWPSSEASMGAMGWLDLGVVTSALLSEDIRGGK